jgi:hypothetical protein
MIREFGTKNLPNLLENGWRIATRRLRRVDDNGCDSSASVFACELRLRRKADEIRVFFWVAIPLEILDQAYARKEFLDRVLAYDESVLVSLPGNDRTISA